MHLVSLSSELSSLPDSPAVLLVYCRNNVCSNPPRGVLGAECSSDMDCAGVEEYAYFCGMDGKCGGKGAPCRAIGDTAEGLSRVCFSRSSRLLSRYRGFAHSLIQCLRVLRCWILHWRTGSKPYTERETSNSSARSSSSATLPRRNDRLSSST